MEIVGRLDAPQELRTGPNGAEGDRLLSKQGNVEVKMQQDGNLVLYRTDTDSPLWATNTYHKPVTHAVMQGDGNFVLYDDGNNAYWATGSNGFAGAYLELQDDGNLVLYTTDRRPLWASNTSTPGYDPSHFTTGDESVGTAEHMNSEATLASNGLLSGHTRTWCNKLLAGFHGSVIAFITDDTGHIIWPSNPNDTKHQYGVDGTWVGTHDRTDYWTNSVDAATMAQGRHVELRHFLDPRNMLLVDVKIIGKLVADVYPAIKAALA